MEQQEIVSLIRTVRGHRIILDADLARLYGVSTRSLNQALQRNSRRFPEDFAFNLTGDEWACLRSQSVISKRGRGGRRYVPMAFTEHGALMAATVLSSDRAVEMSLYVMRAFVRMRAELAQRNDLASRLAEIERTLIGHDAALRELYAKIRPLLMPPPDPPSRRIGF